MGSEAVSLDEGGEGNNEEESDAGACDVVYREGNGECEGRM